MLFTLTYVSRLAEWVDRTHLENLVASIQDVNASLGVTGLLLVRGSRVMQILEGEEAEVRALFGRIRVDQRHHDVVPIWTNQLRERRFPHWSMGFEALDGDATASPDAADGGGFPASTSGPVLTATTAEQRQFLSQRQDLLRRALISDDRLLSTLAIIMYAHDPREECAEDGEAHLQCRECPPSSSMTTNSYPCPTAQNAFWALVASS